MNSLRLVRILLLLRRTTKRLEPRLLKARARRILMRSINHSVAVLLAPLLWGYEFRLPWLG